jgi:hypothetical protein
VDLLFLRQKILFHSYFVLICQKKTDKRSKSIKKIHVFLMGYETIKSGGTSSWSLPIFFPSPTMPIQLPLQAIGINLPTLPADPPTLNDIVAAKNYERKVNAALGKSPPSSSYTSYLTNAHSDAATPRAN